jgi:hypothetical protein
MGLLSTSEWPNLPANSVALSESGRFRSTRNFDDTVEFFQKSLASDAVRWIHIVNLPSVKAEHIESLRSTSSWEGINIYEARGEVRFFIIPRTKR